MKNSKKTLPPPCSWVLRRADGRSGMRVGIHDGRDLYRGSMNTGPRWVKTVFLVFMTMRLYDGFSGLTGGAFASYNFWLGGFHKVASSVSYWNANGSS